MLLESVVHCSDWYLDPVGIDSFVQGRSPCHIGWCGGILQSQSAHVRSNEKIKVQCSPSEGKMMGLSGRDGSVKQNTPASASAVPPKLIRQSPLHPCLDNLISDIHTSRRNKRRQLLRRQCNERLLHARLQRRILRRPDRLRSIPDPRRRHIYRQPHERIRVLDGLERLARVEIVGQAWPGTWGAPRPGTRGNALGSAVW